MSNPMTLVRDGWFALGVLLLVWSFRVKRMAYEESLESRLPHLLAVTSAFVLVFDGGLPLGGLNNSWLPAAVWLSVPGLVLCLVGWAFTVWARIVIGGNWSAGVQVKQEHTLTQSGPYAIVRHPIYSGMLLAMLGTALVDGHIRSAVGFLLLAALLKMKSESEERLMRHTFGPAYDAYSRSTGGLLPRLR